MEKTIEEIKTEEYKNYIQNHRNNIAIAIDEMKSKSNCVEVIKSHTSRHDKSLDIMFDYIAQTHDKSKYSKSEFGPYRKKYFPVSDEEKLEVEKDGSYDAAKRHHYLMNRHHWNYWVLTSGVTPNDMQYIDVLEMVIDWISMSIAFGGKAIDWYRSKDDIVLGDKQRYWVEELLGEFYKE